MRLLPILLLAACTPIEPEANEVETREWPSILETKASDPAPLLAAERAAPPLEPVVREASDRWLASDAALRAKLEPLARKIEEDGSLAGWGTGGGVATFDIALTQEGWDKLVEQEGWEIPPYVTLRFVHPLIAPAMSEAAKDWVKLLAAEPTRTVFQLEALGTGRIFLEDGCLYVGNPDGVKSLAFFHAETGVDVREGGLVLVNRVTDRVLGRVGEEFSWGAPNAFKEEWDSAKALREQCGDADVVNVGTPEASSLFEARHAG